jgi:hypothetical protein
MLESVYRLMFKSSAYDSVLVHLVVLFVASSARIRITGKAVQASALFRSSIHCVYSCHATLWFPFCEQKQMAEEDFAKLYLVFPIYN